MSETTIAICVAIFFALTTIYFASKKIQLNNDIIRESNKLQDDIVSYLNDIGTLRSEYDKLNSDVNTLISKKISSEEILTSLQQTIDSTLAAQKELSDMAFNNYVEVLAHNYAETEEEYRDLLTSLTNSYSAMQMNLIAETESYRQELDKIKATRTAAIEAQKREKEIEDNISSYCINLSELDKIDIAKLEALKSSLSKPRVLSMLIWQTWVQKPLKALAANLNAIGKTGIYKITNIKTKECYIGQSVDIGGTRWPEHCKCGLGIDTPAGNKLYAAMAEYGIWNFSFEVLEECPQSQLNEKERYYINLYDSYNFGYNGNRGINK